MFTLVNTLRPDYIATDVVGTFETFTLAESYKDAMPHGSEYTVQAVGTPDMSLLADKLAVKAVIDNSTLSIGTDGEIFVSTSKISAIRDLRFATNMSLRDSRALVERVQLVDNRFTLIPAWEAELLKNGYSETFAETEQF